MTDASDDTTTRTNDDADDQTVEDDERETPTPDADDATADGGGQETPTADADDPTADEANEAATDDETHETTTGDTDGGVIETVDVAAAFDSFDEQWAPRVAARLNGQAVKLARLDGEFVWHSHPDADELFWVIEGGPLRLAFRDRPDTVLDPGQLAVVSAGVDHKPVADDEAKVALFEPAATTNTGDAGGDRTREAVALADDHDE